MLEEAFDVLDQLQFLYFRHASKSAALFARLHFKLLERLLTANDNLKPIGSSSFSSVADELLSLAMQLDVSKVLQCPMWTRFFSFCGKWNLFLNTPTESPIGNG